VSVKTSKFLSLVLRHQPDLVGITLDEAGWTDVDTLLAGCARQGVPLTRAELEALVRDSDKQRYALSADGTRIRAHQGHSVTVALDLPDVTPPPRLYHGTFPEAVAGIRAHGLVKGKRHAVHLAADAQSASQVGMRRGAPVVIVIRADELAAAGHRFQRSENGVWLTEHVPLAFLDIPSVPARGEWQHWAGKASVSRGGIAEKTQRAVAAGRYPAPSGAEVDLAPAIAAARARTVLHELGEPLRPPERRGPTRITVVAESTNQAIARLGTTPGHVAALNFASAKNPGGGWLGGARAQEESIARASALVACLDAQPAHYQRNRGQRSALYLDLAIFSPGVPFFRDDDGAWLERPILASIITAAAPNVSALRQHQSPDLARVETTLRRRARFVLDVAAHHGVERLILGAWGAGVFGNDPVLVADSFAVPLLGDLAGVFTEVVFAILGGPGAPNHDAFVRRFA
jgi:uncharacterized protein (TIGR02452 family)